MIGTGNSVCKNRLLGRHPIPYNPPCAATRRGKDDEKLEQNHRVKELQMQQLGSYQIAKEVGMDPKTVRKYMEQEGFSSKAPFVEQRGSKLDPYKATIEVWLKEDERNRYKQRHTAKRVYDRLIPKHPDFDCSYPTVVRYVREVRQQQKLSKNGFLELQWYPGKRKPTSANAI